MPSPWSRALACLFLVGCSEQLSGEWVITAAELGTGPDSSIQDFDGNIVIERNGSAELLIQAGDPDGDFLKIKVEGLATNTTDDAFSLVLTGYQEVPQNAIFIDLDLQCESTETDADCSGTWESLGLDSQSFSMELSRL